MSKRSCYHIPMKYHLKKTVTTLYFFLGKLAKVLLRNFITTHWEHFDTFIQCTDGCTDVPWLLVQTYHNISCSHKRYTNCPLNQHMICLNYDEVQASLY